MWLVLGSDKEASINFVIKIASIYYMVLVYNVIDGLFLKEIYVVTIDININPGSPILEQISVHKSMNLSTEYSEELCVLGGFLVVEVLGLAI